MKFLEYLFLSQNIYGVCDEDPENPQFFRLSDCKIYKGKKPTITWFEECAQKEQYLDDYENKTEELRSDRKTSGTQEGRRLVERLMKKIPFTPIFKNKDLDARDAKALFNPIDYIVFDGLYGRDITKVVFFDKKGETPAQKKLQENIKHLITKKQFGWQEVIVKNDGEVIVRNEN